MGDHPNVEVIRNGYRAFETYDLETIQNLFADDVVWHVSGSNPISGDYKGKDAVLAELLGKIIAETEGTFKSAVHDVVGGEQHVVALTHTTATRKGKALDLDGSTVFHLRGGKVVEAWSTPFEQRLEDEFWS